MQWEGKVTACGLEEHARCKRTSALRNLTYQMGRAETGQILNQLAGWYSYRPCTTRENRMSCLRVSKVGMSVCVILIQY